MGPLRTLRDYEGSVGDHVGMVFGQPHTRRGQRAPPLGSEGLWGFVISQTGPSLIRQVHTGRVKGDLVNSLLIRITRVTV